MRINRNYKLFCNESNIRPRKLSSEEVYVLNMFDNSVDRDIHLLLTHSYFCKIHYFLISDSKFDNKTIVINSTQKIKVFI